MLLDKGDKITYSYTLESAEFPENGIVPAKDFWFEGEEVPEVTTAGEAPTETY